MGTDLQTTMPKRDSEVQASRLTIEELYNNFNPVAACKLVCMPIKGQDSRHQLLAANMLLAWILWFQEAKKQEDILKQEKVVRQAVRTAARITARSIMVHLQITAEKAYLRERRKPGFSAKERRISSYVKYMTALQSHTQSIEFFTFFNEVFLPLGGWGAVSKTMSDTSFRKRVIAKWKQAQTVGFLTDYFLRCIAGGKTEYATLNRATWFLDDCVGYGQENVRNLSSSATLWGKFKSNSPLIFGLLNTSDSRFRSGLTFGIEAAKCSSDIITSTQQILRTGDLAARNLQTLPTLVSKGEQFFETGLCLGRDIILDHSHVSPFSSEEISELKKYTSQ
jgi:hypothetical protein